MRASPPLRPAIQRSGIRGLALVTVLWLISLLTVLATAMLAITRGHSQMASRTAELITAQATADSALRLTLLRINAPLKDGQQLAFDAQWPLHLFGKTVRIRVEREAGRVDLNATDATLLAAVFIAGGVDPGKARSFASRIIDWRDADSQPGPDGAELAEYERAKLDYGPRNGPFESIGELRQVLGLADLSPRILDAFTVYSTRSPTIVRDLAHPLVQRAMDALSDAPRSDAKNMLASANAAAAGTQRLIGQVVRIHACADERAVKLCRAVIARLTTDAQKPFLIYDWYTEGP